MKNKILLFAIIFMFLIVATQKVQAIGGIGGLTKSFFGGIVVNVPAKEVQEKINKGYKCDSLASFTMRTQAGKEFSFSTRNALAQTRSSKIDIKKAILGAYSTSPENVKCEKPSNDKKKVERILLTIPYKTTIYGVTAGIVS